MQVRITEGGSLAHICLGQHLRRIDFNEELKGKKDVLFNLSENGIIRIL